MVWKNSELDPTKYVHELDTAEVAEVRLAVIHFKCKRVLSLLHRHLVTKNQCPALPALPSPRRHSP